MVLVYLYVAFLYYLLHSLIENEPCDVNDCLSITLCYLSLEN